MTLNEFQDYLGKRAEEFLEKSDRMSTDILKDLYSPSVWFIRMFMPSLL